MCASQCSYDLWNFSLHHATVRSIQALKKWCNVWCNPLPRPAALHNSSICSEVCLLCFRLYSANSSQKGPYWSPNLSQKKLHQKHQTARSFVNLSWSTFFDTEWTSPVTQRSVTVVQVCCYDLASHAGKITAIWMFKVSMNNQWMMMNHKHFTTLNTYIILILYTSVIIQQTINLLSYQFVVPNFQSQFPDGWWMQWQIPAMPRERHRKLYSAKPPASISISAMIMCKIDDKYHATKMTNSHLWISDSGIKSVDDFIKLS